ncbi:MAG: SDR family NAD(P)-dependent oxidoreductase [Actinomycetota bacterium]|nr:SDR family NAD(P)-dependent oxidoreductase [Actinomycetota bacterium]
MTAVVVTGSAGFIGSHLCDHLLAEGHRVVGVDNMATGRRENLAAAEDQEQAFTFVGMDIRDDALLDLFDRHRPEVVMHLAAQSGVRPSLEDPDGDASINILGSLNVLRCAAAAGARKIVYAASGGTIYGEPADLPVKESSANGSHPQSPYGISKKAVLEYLDFYSAQRSLDFTALALGNVYGPRQDPDGEAGVISIFASALLSDRQPTVFGDGEQTRDYVYVHDTVRAFVLALERASHMVVNIGTGIETSVSQIHEMLAAIIGVSPEARSGPQQAGELRRIALDNGLARSTLGWSPATGLEEGLRETVTYLSARYERRSI